MPSIPSPKGRRISERAHRALSACRRYYILNERIKQVTRELGDIACQKYSYDPFEETNVGDLGDLNAVLHEGNAATACLDRYYYRSDFMYEHMCAGCKQKHDLIQYRKELKLRLGAAKRWIGALGKEEQASVSDIAEAP